MNLQIKWVEILIHILKLNQSQNDAAIDNGGLSNVSTSCALTGLSSTNLTCRAWLRLSHSWECCWYPFCRLLCCLSPLALLLCFSTTNLLLGRSYISVYSVIHILFCENCTSLTLHSTQSLAIQIAIRTRKKKRRRCCRRGQQANKSSKRPNKQLKQINTSQTRTSASKQASKRASERASRRATPAFPRARPHRVHSIQQHPSYPQRKPPVRKEAIASFNTHTQPNRTRRGDRRLCSAR